MFAALLLCKEPLGVIDLVLTSQAVLSPSPMDLLLPHAIDCVSTRRTVMVGPMLMLSKVVTPSTSVGSSLGVVQVFQQLPKNAVFLLRGIYL
jgi:hypothetical protein